MTVSGSPRRSLSALGVDVSDELQKIATLIEQTPTDLVFAIARPIGTHTDDVVQALRDRLQVASFDVHHIQLRDLIIKATGQLYQNEAGKGESRRGLMEMGDYLRFTFGNAILARLAISEIYQHRYRRETLRKAKSGRRIAYLITNLMHPAEVAELRSVYKQRFFMIGVHENYDSRLGRILLELETRGYDEDAAQIECQTLMGIDQGLLNTNAVTAAGALSVDDTFHQADLFVNSENAKGAVDNVYRLLDQIFGYPFGTPDIDERNMAFAYLASQCSSAFGRPVGSALVGEKGALLSIGWNDPPAFGGGLYTEASQPDNRDHVIGRDLSDVHKIDAVHQFLANMLNATDWKRDLVNVSDPAAKQWLEDFANASHELAIVPKSVAKSLPALRSIASSRILNLIEFGRPVHAEMAAMMDALRRGVSTVNSTLYVTTFPCHECARHVIAAGVRRVVYVEPYGKSMAADIHAREIELASNTDIASRSQSKVLFEPYEGLSPKRFNELFSWVERKVKARDVARIDGVEVGSKVDWARATGELRPSILGYTKTGDADPTAPYFNLSRLAAEVGVHIDVTSILNSARAGSQSNRQNLPNERS